MNRQLQTSFRAKGFSLLEAIVALTIMATSLLALYAWLSTNVLSLNRVQANSLALQDGRAALEVINTINPMDEPRGSRELPPLSIQWQARPIGERRTGIGQAGYSTQFDLQLFEIEVEVHRDATLTQDFIVRRAGWEIARPIATEEM